MKIGEVAEHSGVPAKTIRYYEQAGLLPAAKRAHNGYRRYDEKDVQILKFVRRARDLGFTVKDVESLLELWRDRQRESADVKTLVAAHVADIDRRILELQTIRQSLMELVHRCHGDDRPDCPILDELAGDSQ